MYNKYNTIIIQKMINRIQQFRVQCMINCLITCPRQNSRVHKNKCLICITRHISLKDKKKQLCQFIVNLLQENISSLSYVCFKTINIPQKSKHINKQVKNTIIWVHRFFCAATTCQTQIQQHNAICRRTYARMLLYNSNMPPPPMKSFPIHLQAFFTYFPGSKRLVGGLLLRYYNCLWSTDEINKKINCLTTI